MITSFLELFEDNITGHLAVLQEKAGELPAVASPPQSPGGTPPAGQAQQSPSKNQGKPYFETCPRDEEGHCLPQEEANRSGRQQAEGGKTPGGAAEQAGTKAPKLSPVAQGIKNALAKYGVEMTEANKQMGDATAELIKLHAGRTRLVGADRDKYKMEVQARLQDGNSKFDNAAREMREEMLSMANKTPSDVFSQQMSQMSPEDVVTAWSAVEALQSYPFVNYPAPKTGQEFAKEFSWYRRYKNFLTAEPAVAEKLTAPAQVLSMNGLNMGGYKPLFQRVLRNLDKKDVAALTDSLEDLKKLMDKDHERTSPGSREQLASFFASAKEAYDNLAGGEAPSVKVSLPRIPDVPYDHPAMDKHHDLLNSIEELEYDPLYANIGNKSSEEDINKANALAHAVWVRARDVFASAPDEEVRRKFGDYATRLMTDYIHPLNTLKKEFNKKRNDTTAGPVEKFVVDHCPELKPLLGKFKVKELNQHARRTLFVLSRAPKTFLEGVANHPKFKALFVSLDKLSTENNLQDLATEKYGTTGQTYDQFGAGVYSPKEKVAVAKTIGSIPLSVATHELGHFVGDVYGLDYDSQLHAAHTRLYDKLDDHEKNASGKTQEDGRRELLARGVEKFVEHGEQKCREMYDDAFVDWLKGNVLDPRPKLQNQLPGANP